MINLSSSARIMVITAHPDDEILGCGATINKWVNSGAEAFALILGTGIASRCGNDKTTLSKDIENLQKNAKESAEIIGYKTISFESFPDNRMDDANLLDIVQKIILYAEMIKPDIVFTHHHGDLNIDHRITFNAVITAFRPTRSCSADTILCFETPSSTEWNFPYYKNVFSPNIFVNIEDNINAKIMALNCYKSELCHAPHPRSQESIQAIAKRWGSVADLQYAEAFELIRTRIM